MSTNQELARKYNTTSRQISKSRKRGYLVDNDGKKIAIKMSPAVHSSKSKNGIIKNKGGETKKWGNK